MALSDFSSDELATLPIDRLGLDVLRELAATNEWHTGDYQNRYHVRGEAHETAAIEAIGWLLGRGLIAHGKPGQSSSQAMIITRAGREALRAGLEGARAAERLAIDVHPLLAGARTQFLLGEYELAAFASMREVEIRARDLAGADRSLIGKALMREVFHPESGVLTDMSLDKGERQGIGDLFAGAVATFKNPVSHRQVDYGDATEASEVVLLADLLMRMLDRTAARLKAREGPEASAG